MSHSNFIQFNTSNWKVEAVQDKKHSQIIVKCDGAFISGNEITLGDDRSKISFNNLPCRVSFYKKNENSVETDNDHVGIISTGTFVTTKNTYESNARHVHDPIEHYVLIELFVDNHIFNDLLINRCIPNNLKTQLVIYPKAVDSLNASDNLSDETVISTDIISKNGIGAFNLLFGANELTDCIDMEKMQKDLIFDYMVPWEDHRRHPGKDIQKTQFYFILKQITKLIVTQNTENSPKQKHFIACNLLEEIQVLLNPSPDRLRSPKEIVMDRYSQEFVERVEWLNKDIVWVHGLGYTILAVSSVFDIDYQFDFNELLKLSNKYLHLSNMHVTDLDLLLLDALIFYLAFSVSKEEGYMSVPSLQSKKRIRYLMSFYKEKRMLQALYDGLIGYMSLPQNKQHIKDLKEALINISKSYDIPTPVFAIIEKLIKTKRPVVWPNENYKSFQFCNDFSFATEAMRAKLKNKG